MHQARLNHVDALRGLALLGILQINIQCFTWGSGNVLAYLAPSHLTAEAILYYVQSALIEGKFYPLFAWLFGFGLLRQYDHWRMRQTHGLIARRLARRRMLCLAAFGLLHGCLLFFGDVLLAYAACGTLLVFWLDEEPRHLRAVTCACGGAALIGLFVPLLLDHLPGLADTGEQNLASALSVHQIYTSQAYWGQWQQRLNDEFWQQLGGIPTFWPQVLFWMGIGALAQRHGWLDQPEQHATFWRTAHSIGLRLGLPCALAGSALDLYGAWYEPGQDQPWADVLQGLGSLLTLSYVAVALRWLRAHAQSGVVNTLSQLGRVSLSAYVLQSALMGALLCGWGLGWGAQATRWQLCGLAFVIYAGQVALAKAWLHHYRQGPLEALWRRVYFGS